MPLEGETKLRLERALGAVDDSGTRGTRLLEDARRLCARIRKLLAMNLIPDPPESTPLEIACYALQLPIKAVKSSAGAKNTRPTLRDRTEQSAELLVNVAGGTINEATLDATTLLLTQVHQKKPASQQACLLADALNLEDYGVSGLILQVIQLARQGAGVLSVDDGYQKREQYGYWDARLKDGFHFEAIRQIARRRLENARRVVALLHAELGDDGLP